jgi:hypothetical protein
METGAILDPSRSWRYRLSRRWDPAGATVAFVLLNPSTADETTDDRTLGRCLGFARAWGFGALVVVNCFAWRSTDPAALLRAADPVGPDNDGHILAAAREAQTVVLGWGDRGRLRGRGAEVLALLGGVAEPQCLGRTRRGQPRHPLYVPGGTPLRPFRAQA